MGVDGCRGGGIIAKRRKIHQDARSASGVTSLVVSKPKFNLTLPLLFFLNLNLLLLLPDTINRAASGRRVNRIYRSRSLSLSYTRLALWDAPRRYRRRRHEALLLLSLSLSLSTFFSLVFSLMIVQTIDRCSGFSTSSSSSHETFFFLLFFLSLYGWRFSRSVERYFSRWFARCWWFSDGSSYYS